eukprot:g16873.t1
MKGNFSGWASGMLNGRCRKRKFYWPSLGPLKNWKPRIIDGEGDKRGALLTQEQVNGKSGASPSTLQMANNQVAKSYIQNPLSMAKKGLDVALQGTVQPGEIDIVCPTKARINIALVMVAGHPRKQHMERAVLEQLWEEYVGRHPPLPDDWGLNSSFIGTSPPRAQGMWARGQHGEENEFVDCDGGEDHNSQAGWHDNYAASSRHTNTSSSSSHYGPPRRSDPMHNRMYNQEVHRRLSKHGYFQRDQPAEQWQDARATSTFDEGSMHGGSSRSDPFGSRSCSKSSDPHRAMSNPWGVPPDVLNAAHDLHSQEWGGEEEEIGQEQGYMNMMSEQFAYQDQYYSAPKGCKGSTRAPSTTGQGRASAYRSSMSSGGSPTFSCAQGGPKGKNSAQGYGPEWGSHRQAPRTQQGSSTPYSSSGKKGKHSHTKSASGTTGGKQTVPDTSWMYQKGSGGKRSQSAGPSFPFLDPNARNPRGRPRGQPVNQEDDCAAMAGPRNVPPPGKETVGSAASTKGGAKSNTNYHAKNGKNAKNGKPKCADFVVRKGGLRTQASSKAAAPVTATDPYAMFRTPQAARPKVHGTAAPEKDDLLNLDRYDDDVEMPTHDDLDAEECDELYGECDLGNELKLDPVTGLPVERPERDRNGNRVVEDLSDDMLTDDDDEEDSEFGLDPCDFLCADDNWSEGGTWIGEGDEWEHMVELARQEFEQQLNERAALAAAKK